MDADKGKPLIYLCPTSVPGRTKARNQTKTQTFYFILFFFPWEFSQRGAPVKNGFQSRFDLMPWIDEKKYGRLRFEGMNRTSSGVGHPRSMPWNEENDLPFSHATFFFLFYFFLFFSTSNSFPRPFFLVFAKVFFSFFPLLLQFIYSHQTTT